ncbi:unnamed protein product [Paramecium sonneborni]|uniref:Uncharacterized protein n=1 Tax=Paramecium sonneborni TaxID=65129 RepID=A0A8S1P991_9CILI|nr:unnamed protein product [Paramecium sonneborni]
MSQTYVIKEEEQQTPAIQETYVLNKSYNSTFLQHEKIIRENFLFALRRLQEAQLKEQNQEFPKYPFVYQYRQNEMLVHLGIQNVFQRERQDFNKENYQLQHFCLNQKPIPSIKLSVQKRKGFSIYDQKDSKNIPKNYCKAIITFAQKNQQLCVKILGDQLKATRFIEHLTSHKNKLLNIKVFSALLQQSENKTHEEFNRTFRIISKIFVKKFAINYIYNSKIIQDNWHTRYRNKIYKAIKCPKKFSHIKKL